MLISISAIFFRFQWPLLPARTLWAVQDYLLWRDAGQFVMCARKRKEHGKDKQASNSFTAVKGTLCFDNVGRMLPERLCELGLNCPRIRALRFHRRAQTRLQRVNWVTPPPDGLRLRETQRCPAPPQTSPVHPPHSAPSSQSGRVRRPPRGYQPVGTWVNQA